MPVSVKRKIVAAPRLHTYVPNEMYNPNPSFTQRPSKYDTGISCTAVTWASYQIWKIAGCACAGNAGNVSPRPQFQRKPLVCDPGMHHGTCVTHVPWCMSGSLTCDDGENVPGIPGACAPAILRIWQEAHGATTRQAAFSSRLRPWPHEEQRSQSYIIFMNTTSFSD